MTTPTHSYILMDGALVHEQLKASSHFAVPGELFAPLMPDPALALAGPLLISEDHAATDESMRRQVYALLQAFGHWLHAASLKSTLPLAALAEHLRRAVWFTDETGENYGLRIADCRVMAYLPGVLTPDQWNAVTGPLECWVIHDRAGKPQLLPLDEARANSSEPLQGLQLAPEQIERLIDAGEPDALLLLLGRQAGSAWSERHLGDFEAAAACVRHWHAAGSGDRTLLLAFARQVFADAAGNHQDPAWMSRAWQRIAARRR